MRQVVHGIVWFPNPIDQQRVKALMVDYCSARRSAYQAIQRDEKQNDARKIVKQHYRHLGQRYINDAVSEAMKIQQPNALFGGKKAWRDFQKGNITKAEWQSHRNNTLYSRGDKTKKGNPNLRIVNDELWVNEPTVRGKWLKGKLWLNKSVDLTCYEVRIQYKDNRFLVTVSFEVPEVPIKTSTNFGVIGLDVNPDGVALVEVNQEGCIVQQQYCDSSRAMFAQRGKRQYDVRQLAVKVVDEALKVNKSIVLELLKFKHKKSKGRRFNRMKHNFLHRQMIEAIESRAAKMGVGVIKVNPAFTSVIGLLKYADHYSLSRHTAAALVIARLGMGFREVVRVKPKTINKTRVTLEGRSREIDLSGKAFSWMRHLYAVRPKPPGVTPPHPDAGETRQEVLVQSTDCKVEGSITGQNPQETFVSC